MITLFFLRHFPTEFNKNNIWCGCKSDIHIQKSFTNTKEYMELLSFLKSTNFDAIYISPLLRCYETYKMLNLKLSPIVDDRLIERDFGKLEAMVCSPKDKMIMSDFDLNTDLGVGVEKIQDMYYKRILPFLNEIKNKKNGQNVLIIGHSWTGRLIRYFFTHNKNDIYFAPKNGKIEIFKIKN